MFSFPGSNVLCPDSYWKNVSLDILWAFLFNIPLKTLMWTEWNSLRRKTSVVNS